MGYATYLRDLLSPLRFYQLEGGASSGELEGQGAALDGAEANLDWVCREMLVNTAEDVGLDRIEQLLARRPVTTTTEGRRAALAALLRVGGDSFTLEAINDNLAGCGLNAMAREQNEPGKVEVWFPDVPGIPDGFAEMKAIMEDILPCHLGITYVFWYVLWAEVAERVADWGELEDMGMNWLQFTEWVQ